MLHLDVFIDLKTWCGWKETFPCLCNFSIFVCYYVILFDRFDNNFLWNTSLIFFFFCSWSACGYACVCVKAAHGCVHMCMWKIEHSLRCPLCFSSRVAAWSSLSRPGRPVDLGSARLCSLHLITVCATAQVLNRLLMCAWQVLSWLFSHARSTHPFTAASCVAWLATFYCGVKF